MPEYKGPRSGPETVLDHCKCRMPKCYHEPSEAYYGEERLEGRKSSSVALRERGCRRYEPSGVTLQEVMNLRGCEYKWRRVQKGDAEVPAYHG